MNNWIALPKRSIVYKTVFLVIIMLIALTQGIFAITPEYAILSDEVYAPAWQVNDSWIYSGTIEMNIIGGELNINSDELNLKVIDVLEDTYKLQFFGSISGDGEIEDVGEIERIIATMSGFIDLGKTDFSLEKIYDVCIDGKIKIRYVSVIADFEIIIDNANTTPIIDLIDFPLFVGKQWSTPAADLEIKGEITVEGESEEINISKPGAVPSFIFNCTDADQFHLDGYGLDVTTYNISEETQGKIDISYSPEISSFVKITCDELDMTDIVFSADLCLKNTSYIDDSAELSVELTSPRENVVYLWNNLFDLINPMTTFILGKIDIKAEVEGGLGNINVSFYVDGEHKIKLDESPYNFTLDEQMIKNNCLIRTVATDEFGRQAEDSIYVTIINLGMC